MLSDCDGQLLTHLNVGDLLRRMENAGENTSSYLRRRADRHISTHGSFCTTHRLAHKCGHEREKDLKAKSK